MSIELITLRTNVNIVDAPSVVIGFSYTTPVVAFLRGDTPRLLMLSPSPSRTTSKHIRECREYIAERAGARWLTEGEDVTAAELDAALNPPTDAPMAYQRWKAPNDTSGNPRRLYVFFTRSGGIAKVIDENYAGRPILDCGDLPELASVNIKAREYNSLLKEAVARRSS